MRAYEVFYGYCCWLIIIIGSFDRLLICTSMPTTTDTPTLLPQELITVPGNSFVEHWQHVNKTCLSAPLSGNNCDKTINVEHLRDLARHMRSDVEPCDDFYQYACGSWPKDERYHKEVNMMKYGDEQVVKQYVDLFTQAQVNHHVADALKDNIIFDKMYHYFIVCQRDQQSGTSRKLRGYAEALHSQGVWNASDNWLDTLGRLGRYGYAEHYLKLAVKQRNVSHHEIQILPHDKEMRVKLDHEIFDIISIYTHHTFESLTRAFQSFEKELEDIIDKSPTDCTTAELDENNECYFHYYSYNQLLNATPNIKWHRFIALHLGRTPQPNDVFAVDALRTIERLVEFLDNADIELKLMYTVVRFFNYLQRNLQILLEPQTDTVNNRCVRHMRKTLYLPMLYIYEVSIYAPHRNHNERLIRRVFHELKNEFASTLKRNDMGFSNVTLEYLQAKLESLRLNMGNLPQNASHQLYMDYVEDVKFSSNFYYNHLHALKHYFDKLHVLAQIDGGSRNYPDWYTFNCHSPDMPDNVDSTAYFYVIGNMIVMPFAYLQRPFFDNQFWPALLYGDLANTLGHEMMHAFDKNFILYDHAGNMADNYKEIFANVEFQRRLKILEVGTEHVGERIADISGSRLALQTFLGDTDFRNSNGKLYFLQFAQFFCGNEEDVSKTNDIYHDINSERLNYVVAHLNEFTQVFQCPVGSAMNLEQRNVMW